MDTNEKFERFPGNEIVEKGDGGHQTAGTTADGSSLRVDDEVTPDGCLGNNSNNSHNSHGDAGSGVPSRECPKNCVNHPG